MVDVLMVDDRVGRLRVDASVKATGLGSPEVEFGMAIQAFGLGTFIVSAYGDVDLVTAAELETELLETVHDGARRVVVDLTETTFFDSSGVHAVVRCGELLQSSGVQFGVVCANPRIKRILEITGIDHTFGVHATIEDAISPSRAPETSPVVIPLRPRDGGPHA
jgi:anti-sigma B factor antagonist